MSKPSPQSRTAIERATQIMALDPKYISSGSLNTVQAAVKAVDQHLSSHGLTKEEADILLFYASRFPPSQRKDSLVRFAYCIARYRPEDAFTDSDYELIDLATEGIAKTAEDTGTTKDDISQRERTVVACWQKCHEIRKGHGSVISASTSILDSFETISVLSTQQTLDAGKIDTTKAARIANLMRKNPDMFHVPAATTVEGPWDSLLCLANGPVLPEYDVAAQMTMPDTLEEIEAARNLRLADHEYLLQQLINNDALLWRLKSEWILRAKEKEE
ncbi:hypothetical protein CEP51_014474 [Fusarium floridanum]|uniref:Uncharacterized protein n=1 Tax=Fusarium floridanum TaxID=1325733 RepID=A0A428PSC6_9HYPO|nr:hypothetical protein CEP51_014474 [Fusarium floridanum]